MTFLFTDIEGSTRRWEADADAMRVGLAAHDKALRAAIEAHDGFLFTTRGWGGCRVRLAEGGCPRGDQTYESLARIGETMTMAAIAVFVYDQIDQARTELERLR